MAGKGAKATAAKSADKDKGKKTGGPVSHSSRAAPQEKSAPKKDVYQLFAEKVRDNKQLESRWAIMQENRMEYFRGKDFNTFVKNHPEVREI
ncbi:hypothetical protein Zm00014a_030954 [Zea mays]|uniref:Translocation protein SEC62 n=1 Tax=Zea mays TaxID=4577 RepID=A0A3L6E4Q5_MAIZE|nr:hypothetical protein Zm00014a_030954 [Zea mays]